MKNRSVQLDALRGVAALAVLFAHADAYDLVKSPFLTEHKIFLGHFGVALFFILSGGMIWRSIQRADLGTYALNRITRIAPLYFACIAFVVLAMPLIGSYYIFNVTSETIWRHVTFTQSFGDNVSRSLNPVLWTLSWEMAFYIVVPLLLLFSRWINPAWFLIPAVMATPWAQFVGLFAIGIALEEIRAGRSSLPRGAALALAIVAFLAISRPEWVLPCGVAIAAGVLYAVPLPKWTGITLAPLAFVGLVSYSLYIWHYLLLEIAGWKLDDIRAVMGPVFRDDLWRALIVLATILVISTASYLVIERPFMGPVRRWLTAPKHKLATA